MADVKWIKITTDMFENRKIRYLRRLPDGSNIVLIWVMLLTIAGRCNAGGMIYLTENIPYTVKMLADELGFKESTVSAAMSALETLKMVSKNKDCFCIVNWNEYQNAGGMEKIKEQNRARAAKHREKKKSSENGDSSVTDNENVTQSNVTDNVTNNVTVTQSNATEEEEEEDEKEREYHSLTLSRAQGEKSEIQLDNLGGELGKGVVMLSEKQISDLLEKLSVDEFNKYVAIVADCELKGKRFRKKSHYQAILDMVARDRRVEESG